MFFSVIIPLYNKAPYIRKAVESVVAQTFHDWELVVVDDGSTDKSVDVLKAIDDPRIRLIAETNRGVSYARNNGAAHTTAPWLLFLDADDWWEPTFLEEMAALISRHPDAGVYATGYNLVKKGHIRKAPIGVDRSFSEGEIDYCRTYSRVLCMPLFIGACCIPRAVFDEQHGFPENIRLGEDFLFWIHLVRKHRVILLNKQLSNYNQDADPTFRATRHLHDPAVHMLWHLDDLQEWESSNADYKQLVDNLRVYSLQPYYASRRYRQAARVELDKVDWHRQLGKVRRYYRLPPCIIRLHKALLERLYSLFRHPSLFTARP